MQTDWLELWRELITANPHTPSSEPIKRYKRHASRGRQRPDPLLDFILGAIDKNDTVLDIGVGDGRWAIPIARLARSVTAVDPDTDILDRLRANIETSPGNIRIIQSSWEEADVETHDIVVSAHAIYSSPDLALFVRKMEQYARKTCYLSLRLPPVDGVINQLSSVIHGRYHDSANAIVAYNAFYAMGIYPNVLVEKDIHHWVNDTLEEAFKRAKRHLRVQSTGTYDHLIMDTLRRRLSLSNNRYVWPDGMRSAMLWWTPATASDNAGL